MKKIALFLTISLLTNAAFANARGSKMLVEVLKGLKDKQIKVTTLPRLTDTFSNGIIKIGDNEAMHIIRLKNGTSVVLDQTIAEVNPATEYVMRIRIGYSGSSFESLGKIDLEKALGKKMTSEAWNLERKLKATGESNLVTFRRTNGTILNSNDSSIVGAIEVGDDAIDPLTLTSFVEDLANSLARFER